MDLKNDLISICSTINTFLTSSYTIKYMAKINLNRWGVSKLKVDGIIFAPYTELSKKYISYINELEFLPKYIIDMLRDIAGLKKTSYHGVKKIILIYSF